MTKDMKWNNKKLFIWWSISSHVYTPWARTFHHSYLFDVLVTTDLPTLTNLMVCFCVCLYFVCVCVCVVIITTHAVHDVLQVLESSVLCSAASCVLLLLLLTLVFCSLCSWSRCVLGSRCCGGGPEWCSAHSWRQDINVSWLFNTLFLCSCCEFKT